MNEWIAHWGKFSTVYKLWKKTTVILWWMQDLQIIAFVTLGKLMFNRLNFLWNDEQTVKVSENNFHFWQFHG